jgi:hypothetical protein
MIYPDNRGAESPGTDEAGGKPPEVVVRCPKCGWKNVRPSRSKGLFDAIFGIVSVRPYRCRSCFHRFHRFRRRPDPAE